MDGHEDEPTTQTDPATIQVVLLEPDTLGPDPFADDLLLTHVRAYALTDLIRRARPPYVISIDAEWGNGKTTFLKMLKQHLQSEGFGVIAFNAWEHDFTDNPVTTLAGEIVRQTKCFGRKSLRDRATELAKAVAPIAIEVGAGTIPAAATGNIPGIVANLVKGMSKIVPILSRNDPISKYEQTAKGIANFKKALCQTAKAVSDQHYGKPMVVAIDELDRCRPDFAVRFLEIIKHFFSTPNTVFVITTNLDQMAHTVGAVYGQNFDAKEYLDRFFDLPCKLTHDNKEAFINSRLKDIQGHWSGLETILTGEIGEMSPPKSPESFAEDMRTATQLLKGYCERSQISLRRINKITGRVRLVLDILDYNHSEAVVAIAIVCIIRDGNPETYQRILDGFATDEDIVGAMDATAGQLDTPRFREIAEGTALGLARVLPANDHRSGSSMDPSQRRYELTERIRATSNSSGLPQEERESAAKRIERHNRIIEIESESRFTISDAIKTAELITPWKAIV